jgi:hypothetical protein
MAQVQDLPPIDDDEKVPITFDFAPELSTGTAVASIVAVTCSAIFGIDTNPSARILGSAILAPSPSTGVANQAVRQMVGTMIGGERYRLQCLANISDGQILNIDTHADCNATS